VEGGGRGMKAADAMRCDATNRSALCKINISHYLDIQQSMWLSLDRQ